MTQLDQLCCSTSFFCCSAVVIKERVVVFAFRYILRSITLLGELVVYQTKFTSLLSWGDTIQADETWHSRQCRHTWGGGRTDQTHQWERPLGTGIRWKFHMNQPCTPSCLWSRASCRRHLM